MFPFPFEDMAFLRKEGGWGEGGRGKLPCRNVDQTTSTGMFFLGSNSLLSQEHKIAPQSKSQFSSYKICLGFEVKHFVDNLCMPKDDE